MGEEVRIVKYNGSGGVGGGGGNGRDDDRVLEWEDGLPGLDDLTPLSQALLPPELASAFRITAEPQRTLMEVNRASKNTLTSIRGQFSGFEEANNFKSFEGEDGYREQNPIVVDNEETAVDLTLDCLDSRKVRRIEAVVEESDSKTDRNSNNNHNNNTSTTNMSVSISYDDLGSAKTSKRPRLVWTPQLHKRFVDVVAHLGIKNAVPKTIMQLMNVEGLTRENVASHLQKYRLYLKRMQGLSDEGPSASDHLFASTPVPQSLHESGGGNGGDNAAGHGNGHHGHHQSNGNGPFGMPIPIPYPPPPPQMMHMPYIGMAAHGHGHVGVPPGNGYHGYEAHHQYNTMQNKFVSFPQYHNHVAPNDN